MSTLSDSLTVGILLALIFGALGFYLYSRLGQNEKRVSLLENLLLSLKMSTEASLAGPDSVEPVSSPAPLQEEDVDTVDEEKYADLLKELPAASSSSSSAASASAASSASASSSSSSLAAASLAAPESEENEATELLRAMSLAEPRKMDANYESMSVKELHALVKQRGLNAPSQRKKDLIDTLKRQNSPSGTIAHALSPPPEPPVDTTPEPVIVPTVPSVNDLDGADSGIEGFFVQ